ncbi:uncharacterized protein LOC118644367 [Monomorium pharaonis]|uniref:uncharacterized protein LOC118644367 n=1 Tax=Monomorium pharaonis TaxID=307658 RepID=UPI001745F36D|nr:uncharacterized protein LOC118644367 [Monomorium pharaonis]
MSTNTSSPYIPPTLTNTYTALSTSHTINKNTSSHTSYIPPTLTNTYTALSTSHTINKNAPSYTYVPPTSTTYTTLSTSHTLDTYDNNNFSDSSAPILTDTRTDGVIFNNNAHEIPFQANTRSCTMHNNQHVNYETSARTSDINNWSINMLHERMDRMETEFKRTNTLLQNILKCVQPNNQGVPRKPAVLPISSIAENMNEDDYNDVVNYLCYIGGLNLKGTVNLCLKETLKDTVTASFTWWGREKREGVQRPLYNARLIIAIYDAVYKNRYFPKPTRTEFQTQAKEALRAAKERARTKLQGPRARMPVPRNRNFWNDEPERE